MKALLKKEFLLCTHPTCFIFLCFCCFVFIPNYPYEVMFFFSGLSAFFVCLTARENGDAGFTLSLPAERRNAVRARMIFCMSFQIAQLCLAAIATAIKELVYAPELQVNMAGMMANAAFLGFGALILACFNLIFFPLYYRNVTRVGIPFLLASTAEFLLIFLLVIFRFTLPLFMNVLNTPDPDNIALKLCVLAAGIGLYALFSGLAMHLAGNKFLKADL